MHHRRLLAPPVAVVLAMTAACGNDGAEPDTASEVTSTTAAPTTTAAPSTTATADTAAAAEEPPEPELASQLPHVDVVRIESGESVDLQSLAPASTPILAWFWAPH